MYSILTSMIQLKHYFISISNQHTNLLKHTQIHSDIYI